MANQYAAPFSRLFSYALLAGALLGSVVAQAQCPVASTCATAPGLATNPNARFLNAGIYSVKLGAQAAFTSQGYTEGYRDNSCTLGLQLAAGTSDSIVVRTGTTVDENVRVWLDINGDGALDPTAELVFSSAGRVHRGLINVPGTVAVGRRLRLRIASDAVVAGIPTPCSTPEYSQTEDYYIDPQANTAPPIAVFASNDTVTCSGTVQFMDQSRQGPTHWEWDFGDNSTPDTTRNPSHFYGTSGTFSVRLIVSNANGSDTLLRPNYIRFNDTIPVAASCHPATSGYCCGYGITRLRISNMRGTSLLDNSSANGAAGYEDFTCQRRVRLVEGKAYRIRLDLNPNQPQHTSIWLDTSGNGVFEAGERLLNVASSTVSLDDTFTIPTTRRRSPIRMRVTSDVVSTTLTGCTAPQLGQVEDYTVLVQENVLAPIASFTISARSNCDSTVTLTSTSENSVTRYRWYLGDGRVVDTTASSITFSYDTTRVYTVGLVVTGPFGRDSISQGNAIVYLPAPQAACTLRTTRSCCNIGISRVQFASINNASGDAETEGYQDFACAATTSLLASRSYPITIVNGPRNPESVRVWIDFNNSGTFDTAELVFSSNNAITHSGTITIPDTAVKLTPLRMRVVSGAAQTVTDNPCGTNGAIDFGQAEDYSVTIAPNTAAPVAAFGANVTLTCSGDITFSDSSQNSITRYHWDFGDGDTSNVQSPSHLYADTGSYTVTLVVTGPNGSDTLVRPGYIRIVPSLNLAAACHIPAVTNFCCQFGVYGVTFAGITSVSGDGSEGAYIDRTCTNIAQVQSGSTYTLTIHTGNTNQLVRAWIDWNSDGQYTADEIVADGRSFQQLISQVTVPLTAVGGRGLRMRVMAGGQAGGQALDACQDLQNGQTEDFSVVVEVVQLPPVTRFAALSTTSCNGVAQFKDSTLNQPIHWLWKFGDGATDTTRNPSHRYTATGTYTVTLIATNSFGLDSIVRSNYITITGLRGVPSACLPVYTFPTAGTDITEVTIGSTVIASPANEIGYFDRSCQQTVNLSLGGQQTFGVRDAGTQFLLLQAWIDYNGDSAFTQDEIIIQQPFNGTTQAFFTPPATAVTGRPLRLRVLTVRPGAGTQFPFDACGSFTDAHTEDYAVQFQALRPQANFSVLGGESCTGRVRFIDSTLNGALTYLWDFGDGTFSTDQSPIHDYTSTGTFDVKLVVTNAIGSDSITITQAVTVGSVYQAGSAGLQPPVCMPTVQINNIGRVTAMTRFIFRQVGTTTGLIDQTSQGLGAGYEDFACTDSARVDRTNPRGYEFVATLVRPQQGFGTATVYLDANRDGMFAFNERVGFSNGQGTPAAITLPATLVYYTWYRMRVVAAGQYNEANCVTIDGQAEDYSVHVVPIDAIKPSLAAEPLALSPNPATDAVRLTATLASAGQATLRVLDATGRLVMTQDLGHLAGTLNQEVKLAGMPKGLYTLQLEAAGKVYMGRLVKE